MEKPCTVEGSSESLIFIIHCISFYKCLSLRDGRDLGELYFTDKLKQVYHCKQEQTSQAQNKNCNKFVKQSIDYKL